MLSSMGVEVVDERPYELDGLERPIVHLRVRAALRPASCPSGARELFQDALRAVWDGYNEIDGFNGAGARRRADLAAGDRAARLREVHAAGRHAVRAGLHRGRAARQRRHHPAAGRAVRGAVRPGRAATGDGEARRRGSEIEERIIARPRRRRQPRPRPDPALLPHPHPGDAAHQLLPARRPERAGATALHLVQARAVGDPGPARAAAAVRDLRLLAAGRGRAPALRRRSRAAACAGPTGATTSAPRCSAWSRRRWSRTP